MADLEFACDGAPWIPPDTYEAVGKGADLVRHKRWERWSLVVRFDVMVPDEKAQNGFRIVELERFYNVDRIGNRINVPKHGAYAREWSVVAGRPMGRRDRPHVNSFLGALCLVEVETVQEDGKQRPLPETTRYSKIARIVACRAGGVRP